MALALTTCTNAVRPSTKCSCATQTSNEFAQICTTRTIAACPIATSTYIKCKSNNFFFVHQLLSRNLAFAHSRTLAFSHDRTLTRSKSHPQTIAQANFCTCTLPHAHALALSKSRSCVHAPEHTHTSHTTSRTFTLLLSHARNIGRMYHRMITPLRSSTRALWQHRAPALLHSRTHAISQTLTLTFSHSLSPPHSDIFTHRTFERFSSTDTQNRKRSPYSILGYFVSHLFKIFYTRTYSHSHTGTNSRAFFFCQFRTPKISHTFGLQHTHFCHTTSRSRICILEFPHFSSYFRTHQNRILQLLHSHTPTHTHIPTHPLSHPLTFACIRTEIHRTKAFLQSVAHGKAQAAPRILRASAQAWYLASC